MIWEEWNSPFLNKRVLNVVQHRANFWDENSRKRKVVLTRIGAIVLLKKQYILIITSKGTKLLRLARKLGCLCLTEKNKSCEETNTICKLFSLKKFEKYFDSKRERARERGQKDFLGWIFFLNFYQIFLYLKFKVRIKAFFALKLIEFSAKMFENRKRISPNEKVLRYFIKGMWFHICGVYSLVFSFFSQHNDKDSTKFD